MHSKITPYLKAIGTRLQRNQSATIKKVDKKLVTSKCIRRLRIKSHNINSLRIISSPGNSRNTKNTNSTNKTEEVNSNVKLTTKPGNSSNISNRSNISNSNSSSNATKVDSPNSINNNYQIPIILCPKTKIGDNQVRQGPNLQLREDHQEEIQVACRRLNLKAK